MNHLSESSFKNEGRELTTHDTCLWQEMSPWQKKRETFTIDKQVAQSTLGLTHNAVDEESLEKEKDSQIEVAEEELEEWNLEL